MSLDQMVGSLIAAINANTAALQALGNGNVATQAVPLTNVAPANVAFPGAAPAAPPAAMPPSPFPAAAPAAPPQPACPFNDAASLQAWAYQKYQANPALMPAMQAIIEQHGLAQMDKARPDQLPSLYNAINAL